MVWFKWYTERNAFALSLTKIKWINWTNTWRYAYNVSSVPQHQLNGIQWPAEISTIYFPHTNSYRFVYIYICICVNFLSVFVFFVIFHCRTRVYALPIHRYALALCVRRKQKCKAVETDTFTQLVQAYF